MKLVLFAVLLATSHEVLASPVQQPLGVSFPTRGSESARVLPESPFCPQNAPLSPSKHNAQLSADIRGVFASGWFANRTIRALSGAVRIPTESFDGMGPVGEDPRFEVFGDLHRYFRETFPLIHTTLRITTVNTYGLVMHWQGSDTSRLPILLTGHQDVVPVEPSTFGQWKHPPYSGYFDGTWIWGRGSCDDKGDVIAILTAVEALLEQGFEPTRTVVLAFGIDEESAGRQGAGKIATYLEATYGRDSFAVLLDEGSGFSSKYGEDIIFATPSTSEKGYLDVRVEVNTPGGHSSVPPPHTAIGILSALVVALEASPYEPTLQRTGTPFAAVQCVANYSPVVPSSLRELARQAIDSDDALEELTHALVQMDPVYAAMLSTTQAVDLVKGGVKVNALPESVNAVVNHRIAEHSSVGELQERIASTLVPLAAKFNLTFTAFNANISSDTPAAGHLTLSDAWGTSLEPAPPTPLDAEPWKVLTGTIRASLGESRKHAGKTVVASPMLAMGNTDTRFYWNLTRHIFRYTHLGSDDGYNGAHTVNEAIRADALIDNVRFLTKFILNWDEADF